MIINLKQFSKHIQRFSQGIFLIPFSRDFLVQKCVDENGRKADMQVCIINLGEAVQNFFGVYEGLNLYISDGYNAVFYRNPSENNIDFTFISSSDVVSSENISSVESSNNNFIVNPNSDLTIEKNNSDISQKSEKIKVVNIPYGFSTIDIYDEKLENFHFCFSIYEKLWWDIVDVRYNQQYEVFEYLSTERFIQNPFQFYDNSKQKPDSLKIKIIFHDEYGFFKYKIKTYCKRYQKDTIYSWLNYPIKEKVSEENRDNLYNEDYQVFYNSKIQVFSNVKMSNFNLNYSEGKNEINVCSGKEINIIYKASSGVDVNLYSGWNEDYNTRTIENNFYGYFFFIKDISND